MGKTLEYNNKRVNILLFKIKRSKDVISINKMKLEIFEMLNPVVTKNISNYIKLCNNSTFDVECFNKTEMIAESYLVLDKCIEGFKITTQNIFYFYYNKSLSRNFYKMFSSHITDIKKSMISAEYLEFRSEKSCDIDEDMNYLLSTIGLNQMEIKVAISKINNVTKSKFLSENIEFNSSQYDESLSRVKEIVGKIKK